VRAANGSLPIHSPDVLALWLVAIALHPGVGRPFWLGPATLFSGGRHRRITRLRVDDSAARRNRCLRLGVRARDRPRLAEAIGNRGHYGQTRDDRPDLRRALRCTASALTGASDLSLIGHLS